MNPYAIQAADLAALQAELGADCPTITLLGRARAVIPGSAMLNEALRNGGFAQMFDLSVSIPLAQFADVATDPAAVVRRVLNAQAKYLGLDYKVTTADLAPGATFLTISLNSLNQRA